MEQYYCKFWWHNPETGFVERRGEFFDAKGKCAHRKVKNMCCKKFGVKHADIITVGYC